MNSASGTATMPQTVEESVELPDAVAARRAFVAILWRDVLVAGRDVPMLLVQTVLQPALLLFVFGTVLGLMGFTSANYTDVLFPGLVAMTTMLAAIQQCSIALSVDFAFTREIEDRLMAPLPASLVAIEKLVFASVQGLFAGAMMFPFGLLLLGDLPWNWSGVPLLVATLVAGSFCGAALGMVMATFVPPNRVQMFFALILMPLAFTGCAQYPWPALSDLPWFQVVALLNPLTYVSEGARAAMLPTVPHLPVPVCLGALLALCVLLTVLAVRGFGRRAVQ